MKKIFLSVFLFILILLSPEKTRAQSYSCEWDGGTCTSTGLFCGVGYPSNISEAEADCSNKTTYTTCCPDNPDPVSCVGSYSCQPGSSSSINWRALESLTLKPGLVSISIGGLVGEILKYIFPIAGLLLLLYLIYGGYNLMLSGGDPKKAAQAKGIITTALIGFIIIFISYWLVKIIGSILGLDDLIGSKGIFK